MCFLTLSTQWEKIKFVQATGSDDDTERMFLNAVQNRAIGGFADACRWSSEGEENVAALARLYVDPTY